MNPARTPRRQRGFLIIAGVFLVVVLAALVVYLGTVSTTSQAASIADQNSARAYQAARTGIEWAVYQILRDPAGGTFRAACAAPGTVSRNQTYGGQLAGFTATVTCTGAGPITEGGASVTVFTIVSYACNEPNASGNACPNNTTVSSVYVDRELSVSLTN